MTDIADKGTSATTSRPGRSPAAAGPSLGLPAGWWPVAHGEEIGRHPGAFRLGAGALAVYRDLAGTVRAVEDACPHRRLPLSMGRLTEDGYLQCAYHGWCFDGVTGRCTAIPNLSKDERVPAGLRVAAFTTAENVADLLGFGLRAPMLAPAVGPPTGEEPDEGTTMFDAALADGLVLVWTGGRAPDATPAPLRRESAVLPGFTGTVEVRAPHRALAEALILNPGATLGLGALLGAGEEACDPVVRTRGGLLTVQRERTASALARVSTFESLSRRVVSSVITVVPATGLTRVEVAPTGRHLGCRVVVGLTPISPYRTVLRWRGEVDGTGALALATQARAAAAARRWTRRAADRPEAVADAIGDAVDDGVLALRANTTAENPGATP